LNVNLALGFGLGQAKQCYYQVCHIIAKLSPNIWLAGLILLVRTHAPCWCQWRAERRVKLAQTRGNTVAKPKSETDSNPYHCSAWPKAKILETKFILATLMLNYRR
jgi:hypothetical protein